MAGDLPSHHRDGNLLRHVISADRFTEEFIRNRERSIWGTENSLFNIRRLWRRSNSVTNDFQSNSNQGHNFMPPSSSNMPETPSIPPQYTQSTIAYITASLLPYLQFERNIVGNAISRVFFFNPSVISTILRMLEITLLRVAFVCGSIREKIINFTNSHLFTDIFASVMDLLLVFYAFGFLFLSTIQASNARN